MVVLGLKGRRAGGFRVGGVQRGGSAERFGVGPGGDLDRLGQEAVGAQGALLLGEQGEALR